MYCKGLKNNKNKTENSPFIAKTAAVYSAKANPRGTIPA
jgi:hypothetical protein